MAVLSLKLLIYAAAACTLIAGILHVLVASNAIGLNFQVGVFFLVAGIAQVFWTLPMVRTWGKVWYVVGLGGTVILIAIWLIAITPGNPITERTVPVEGWGISIAVFEITFIILCAIIITRIRTA
jgi:hypothetical protein